MSGGMHGASALFTAARAMVKCHCAKLTTASWFVSKGPAAAASYLPSLLQHKELPSIAVPACAAARRNSWLVDPAESVRRPFLTGPSAQHNSQHRVAGWG
jgi:hypothetical protein